MKGQHKYPNRASHRSDTPKDAQVLHRGTTLQFVGPPNDVESVKEEADKGESERYVAKIASLKAVTNERAKHQARNVLEEGMGREVEESCFGGHVRIVLLMSSKGMGENCHQRNDN